MCDAMSELYMLRLAGSQSIIKRRRKKRGRERELERSTYAIEEGKSKSGHFFSWAILFCPSMLSGSFNTATNLLVFAAFLLVNSRKIYTIPKKSYWCAWYFSDPAICSIILLVLLQIIKHISIKAHKSIKINWIQFRKKINCYMLAVL